MRKRRCYRCGKPHLRRHSYCKSCHAANMRVWREDHPPSEEQRRRSNARSYAKVYLRRGKIEKKPCEDCGSPDSQMHHKDYNRPLEITWLCRPCHLREHDLER